MPRWAKVVLVVVLLGFAGLVMGVIYAGRWIRSSFDSLGKDTLEAADAGTKYGKTHDANACVDASLERLAKCKGIMCDGNVRVFLVSCFEHASVPPGFCDRVPVTAGDGEKVPEWAREECERRGWKGDDRCVGIVAMMAGPCMRTQRTGTS